MSDQWQSMDKHRPLISFRCVYAMFIKEFIQLRRDRFTFATMIIVPIILLILFGFAINNNPKHIPTVLLNMDDSPFSRSIIAAMNSSDYFKINHVATTEEELDHFIVSGKARFGLQIPANFGRALVRGEKPSFLVIADATDPVGSAGPITALQGMAATIFTRELNGPFAALMPNALKYNINIQKRYNPSGLTRLNVVPGLMGVILTLTMVMFTALSVAREVERGSMEILLAMPIKPVEIMLGKTMPYVVMGAVQMSTILIASRLLFNIPIIGSVFLLVTLTFLLIISVLSVGYTFSTVAKNQLQAMQMSFFFFLPNILISGFAFPFLGMPVWAQWIGETLPLTHYIRIVRGIMLKGATFTDLITEVIALVAFTLAAMALALARFRQTLD